MEGFEGIIEFLQGIMDFIESIIDFALMLIENLFVAIAFIPEMVSSMTSAVAYLPGVLGIFAALFITLMVVNYIIGRGSG